MSTDMVFPQCCALTGRQITDAQLGLQFFLPSEEKRSWKQAGTDMCIYSVGVRSAVRGEVSKCAFINEVNC